MPRAFAPPALLLAGAALLLALAAGPARGQGSSPASAPASGAPDAPAPSSLAPGTSAAFRATAPIPECGLVVVASPSCDFRDVKSQNRAVVTMANPTVTVLNTLDTTMRDVPYGGNSLRQLLQATFPAKPSKPSSYLAAPKASFTVTPSGGGAAVSGTARLIPSREKSVGAPGRDRQYVVKALERGPGNDDVSGFPAGRCTMLIRAPCSQGCPEGEADFGDGCVAVCQEGEADFGDGCVAATATADVCPEGEADFGDGCVAATATADACASGSCITAFASTFDNDGTCVVSCSDPARPFTDGTTCVASCPAGTFVDGRTCVASCPQGVPPSGNKCQCTYADTICAAGIICPGQTAVSAECADRSAFSENPCACTALQELAALSPSLQTVAPWDALANAAYCQAVSPEVFCAPVGGVQLPTEVFGASRGLAGALPPSIGELASSLTYLDLEGNAITSVPTELGALTGLTDLYLDSNAITSLPTEIGALTGLEVLELYSNDLAGVPAEFRTVDPRERCSLFLNPGFSCANVGAGTSCCTADNCAAAGTSSCYSG